MPSWPKGTKTLKVDVFNSEIKLFTSVAQIEQFEKLNGCPNILLRTVGSYYWHFDGDEFMIMTWLDGENSTLIHESVHLAHCIMKSIGSPITFDNTELQAYLTTYIYEGFKGQIK